jgi:hypothetical protein
MNPIVLSTIIASAAFILSVFGASWLNQRAILQSQQDYREFTKALMSELDKRLDARLDSINYRFDGIEAKFDARFNAVDARLTGIEQRLDRLETVIFKPVVSR